MKLITLLCAISLLTACQGTPNHDFTLKGTIKNWKGSIDLIGNITTNGKTKDTMYTTIVDANGNFKFDIKTQEEDLYILQWDQSKDASIYLINDVPNITIEGDARDKKSFVIKNSNTSNTLLEIESFVSNQELLLKKYIDSIAASIKLPTKNIVENDYTLKIKTLQANTKTKLLEYYHKANDPFIKIAVLGTMYDILRNYYDNAVQIINIDKKELLALLEEFIKKYPNNKYLPLLTKSIERNEDTLQQYENKLSKKEAAAKPLLPSFSLPNTEGKIISIDAFKGQYFLLDFWASWCGPCRQENPYLVKAFNRFKNKNFTIVGVSLDDDKDAWLNAITKDNLTWTHLSDLKGWESQAAQLFHINAIPFNLLVDPQGNIIASELRGEMLEQKLEEILK